MRVLVTGGTGVVGRAAIDHLLGRGHEIRLFCRNAGQSGRQWAGPVQVHPGSVTKPGDVHGAADGCDAVLHLAGIAEEDPPEITYHAVNVEGTRRLLAEAERAGARRFVYVSSLGADRGTTDYHQSKRSAEALVAASALDWLIVRPGNVYGPGDKMISELLKIVRAFPVVPTVSAGEQPFQPIFSEDLGEALALAAEGAGDSGAVLEVAGPDQLTANQLVDLLGEVTGKKPYTIPVPEWVGLLGSAAANALGFDIHFSQDQIRMLQEGNLVRAESGNALDTVFGIEPTLIHAGLNELIASLPEQLPADGIGGLREERHWADIRGAGMDADALFRLVCDEFYDIPPEGLLRVGVEPVSGQGLAEGAVLTMAIPLRGHVQVRVEEIHSRAATVVTLQGHPLNGIIRFSVEQLEPDSEGGGALRFEIRSHTRASTMVDFVALSTVGNLLRETTWNTFVGEVVSRSGGEAPDGVQSESRKLPDDESRHIEEWAEEVVMRRRRREERESAGAETA